MAVALGPGVTGQSKRPNASGSPIETAEPGEDWAASPAQDEPDRSQAQQTSQPSVQRPPSKWDEIRAANNKAGSASSWDLIRQGHERNRISSPPSSQPSTRSRNLIGGAVGAGGAGDRDGSPDLDSSIDKSEKQWESRALDEAQFEAVLEAERRRASQA